MNLDLYEHWEEEMMDNYPLDDLFEYLQKHHPNILDKFEDLWISTKVHSSLLDRAGL